MVGINVNVKQVTPGSITDLFDDCWVASLADVDNALEHDVFSECTFLHGYDTLLT